MAEAASGSCTYPREQILGTIYGQAVGDAIGLLTEFLIKEEAKTYFGKVEKKLELQHKELCPDMHRTRWEIGDWTDDTDQMILIMQSLIDHEGEVDPPDFAKKLSIWSRRGYPELGDFGGMGIGATTSKVLDHHEYPGNPSQASFDVWNRNGRDIAPNGAVMRTSILGIHQYWDTDAVAKNAVEICTTTHFDHRCQASTVAASVAISLMLKREPSYLKKSGSYNVDKIINECYRRTVDLLETDDHKKQLKQYLECTKIKDLKLDESRKIGYTFKCLGAGFWALKQKNFRKALQTIVMEGGDADTNGALAGALLGCKLGMSELPESWVSGLIHKKWLDEKIEKYLEVLSCLREGKPIKSATPVAEEKPKVEASSGQ